jgi:hypothetical protein
MFQKVNVGNNLNMEYFLNQKVLSACRLLIVRCILFFHSSRLAACLVSTYLSDRLLCLTLCREAMESHNGEADELPPPPPLAPDCEPIKAEETKVSQKPKRMLVPRNGFGRKGQQIKLCTNHFKVSLKTADEFFHHYYVSLHH